MTWTKTSSALGPLIRSCSSSLMSAGTTFRCVISDMRSEILPSHAFTSGSVDAINVEIKDPFFQYTFRQIKPPSESNTDPLITRVPLIWFTTEKETSSSPSEEQSPVTSRLTFVLKGPNSCS